MKMVGSGRKIVAWNTNAISGTNINKAINNQSNWAMLRRRMPWGGGDGIW